MSKHNTKDQIEGRRDGEREVIRINHEETDMKYIQIILSPTGVQYLFDDDTK